MNKPQINILAAFFNSTPIEEIPLTNCTTPTFNDYYDYISVFGKGSYGLVINAIVKLTGESCAIKIIKKLKCSRSKLDFIKQEAVILKSLSHKNIVKFREMHECPDYLFIVMDQIVGGSLTDMVNTFKKKKQLFSEMDCSIIIKAILEGLQYIHQRNYMHRDLKPDNIMFENIRDISSVKIVDFGLGIKFDAGLSLSNNRNCGTLLYMAPEQTLSNFYSSSVDIWACGIIMFYILTSRHPLYEQVDSSMQYSTLLLNPHWNNLDKLSDLAKDFFLHLCNPNPQGRYSASLALAHPFITRRFSDSIPKSPEEEETINTLIDKLRKTMLTLRFLYSTCKSHEFVKLKQLHESLKGNLIEKQALYSNY